MLTDEQIYAVAKSEGQKLALGSNPNIEMDFARAIEVEVRKEQANKIAELTDALQFVERWAVHHGSKPSTSAESALSVIQHYPPIAAITASYADGKTPDTFNPFEKIAELERQLAEAKKDSERIDAIEFYTREPDEWESKYGRCKNGDTWCWTFYAPKGVQGDTRKIIDAAIKAKVQQ